MSGQAKKRGREEETWEVDEALYQLQATLERDYQHKLRALDRIIALVDASDDNYTIQKALVDGDAAFYITELLADATAGVRAAEAVAAVCRHSAPSLARLTMVGLDSAVERVSLNPCQSDFVDSGALAALVPMALHRSEAQREAAAEAISALCSFHQEGKLAYLEGLVAALAQQQQLGALELLDALIDSMECGGEAAAQQLGLLTTPLLAELRAGCGRPASQAAVGLAGTLCEKRADAAAALRAGGGAAALAQHLLRGSQEVQDAAARALWLLVKDERRRLDGGEQGLLGCDPLELARVLVRLIEVADIEETRAREDFAAPESGAEEAEGPPDGSCATPRADICFAEEASRLLAALAEAHPAVARLVQERDVPAVRATSQKCCIM